MIIIFAVLLIMASAAQCREMCYSCQYTITSTKQGIECTDYFNKSMNLIRCELSCIILSERKKDTGEVRSFFRGCSDRLINRCAEVSGMISCRYSCDKNLCNSVDIETLEVTHGIKKNMSNMITGKNSALFTVFITILIINFLYFSKTVSFVPPNY